MLTNEIIVRLNQRLKVELLHLVHCTRDISFLNNFENVLTNEFIVRLNQRLKLELLHPVHCTGSQSGLCLFLFFNFFKFIYLLFQYLRLSISVFSEPHDSSLKS